MTLFLHVDRIGRIEASDILELQPRRNESHLLYFKNLFTEGFADHIESLCRQGLSAHGITYLIRFFDQSIYTPCLFDELYLEFVRWKEHVDEPSRLQSFFGWRSYEEAEAFAKHEPGKKGTRRILEAEALGRVFKGDMNLTRSLVNEPDKTALSYWNGDRLTNADNYAVPWEYVLELPVRVVREVSVLTVT